MYSGLGAQLEHLVQGLVLSVFVSSILFSVTLTLVPLVVLAIYGAGAVWAWLILAVQLVLAMWPLADTTPPLVRKCVRYCCDCSRNYFPTSVIVEDEAALQPDQAYLLALEPHSALPTAMPAVFSVDSPLLPQALQGRCHGMVADVCFKAPWVRQLYWWWGFRPITKHNITSLLHKGHCPVVVPGGVQECLYMQHGRELAYLRRRQGFIRVAIQQGVPVVPVFAFGQSDTYHWVRPGPPLVSQATVNAMAKQAGFAPLLLYGRWGTVIPNSVPLTVVIGKPIPMPHQKEPTRELVQEHLDKYIRALLELFEQHRARCGYPELQLDIM